MPKTWLGFDYGDKRIGIATGQTLTGTATPLKQLPNNEMFWSQIEVLIKEWKPAGFVVGLPFNMDDSKSKQTRKAQQFADILKKKFQLPVHTVDERLSTREARERLQEHSRKVKKEELNAMAAKIILETWLSLSSLTNPEYH